METKSKIARKELLLSGTQNNHFVNGEFTIEKRKIGEDEVLVIKVKEGEYAWLSHENKDGSEGEHRCIKLEPGEYIVGKQVEFDYKRRLIRQIRD